MGLDAFKSRLASPGNAASLALHLQAMFADHFLSHFEVEPVLVDVAENDPDISKYIVQIPSKFKTEEEQGHFIGNFKRDLIRLFLDSNPLGSRWSMWINQNRTLISSSGVQAEDISGVLPMKFIQQTEKGDVQPLVVSISLFVPDFHRPTDTDGLATLCLSIEPHSPEDLKIPGYF